MLAGLTINNDRYADVRDEMDGLSKSMSELQEDLLLLIDKDAEAFAPLAAAYKMAADDEKKAEAMEAALKKAALAPFETMIKVAEAISLLERLSKTGSKLALSDAACGAALCQGAMKAAWINVLANTKYMKDREFAGKVELEANGLLEKSAELAEKVIDRVMQ